MYFRAIWAHKPTFKDYFRLPTLFTINITIITKEKVTATLVITVRLKQTTVSRFAHLNIIWTWAI